MFFLYVTVNFFLVKVFTDNEIRPGEKRISCMLFDAKHDRMITGIKAWSTLFNKSTAVFYDLSSYRP